MAVQCQLLILSICSLIGQGFGQSATDAKNLKTYLFTTNSYDAEIRPSTDQSLYTTVYVEFNLLAINELDEKAETLKTTGYLAMYWKDELLVWDSATHGGIEYYFYPQNNVWKLDVALKNSYLDYKQLGDKSLNLQVDYDGIVRWAPFQNKVWKPDVALKNSFLDYKQLGDTSLNVQVEYDGFVRWAPFQVFVSTCSIDITKFPFDTQKCEMEFVAWSYTKDEVYMVGDTNGIVLDEYTLNSAWDIVETSWYNKVDADEASIVFVITMKRKPLYNLLTLVFPIIMLAILNLFVFVLPSESGEKSGYAVTVFLAFAVFLTIMEASFPQNSETVAYFAIYVVIETVQSTLITLIALVQLRLHFFDESTKIPRWLICLTRCARCKALRHKFRRARSPTNKVAAQEKNMKITLQELDTKGKQHEQELYDEDKPEEETDYTWKYVVNALDIIFFVFFFASFLAATLVCLLMAQFS